VATVLNLLELLSGKNHRVYMGNYYTSIPLFSKLLRMDIFSTGTIRTNRKGLDKYVTMKKEEERHLKKKTGLPLCGL
jgi:Transposase IS4